jgi:hypothetical protein
MDTNSPADEPTPAPSPEPAAENAVGAVAEDTSFGTGEPFAADTPAEIAPDELDQLAEASQRARLAPTDEERMGALLKEALLGGRGGVARAIDVLPRVPWIVGVRAVETVWPELTNGFRTQLIAGLGKDETDAARRIRLSLARALFKIDEPVGLKLAAGVTRELRDKESGMLTAKQAQIFANVFIGRGKPWLAQMPLADWKPADVDELVHCALLAVFTLPHPPVTQLGVLKWAQEHGRLAKLHENTLEAVRKTVGRWSAKWQNVLRKEVPELPEEIATVLKPAAVESQPGPVPGTDEGPTENALEAETEEIPGEEVEEEDEGEEENDEERDGDEEDDEAPMSKERPVYEPRPQKSPQDTKNRDRESQRERPVYTPRNAGAGGTRNFNLSEALRQIDTHVQSLRNELAAAQAKARQKDDDRRRRPEKLGPIIEGEPTPDELARLNQQLEARNAELQARIDDLAQHSEDVATSMGVMSDQPVSDTGAQLRTLLALKLQEDFADFLALEKESNDLVIQEHYKGLLRHVFEVLQQLEVPLKRE